MVEQSYVVKKNINTERLFQGWGRLMCQLDIELTKRCNNACQHCYINLPENDTKARARELTTAQWQEVLRQAAELGTLTVRFTGGEPLLREDFTELYLFARQLGLKVLLFTNARLITPALADLFTRVPLLERIGITVYGMRSETYDTVACTPGAYADFRQGVELLLERNVPFVVKGALMPQNKDDMQAFDTWAMTIPWMEKSPSYSMFFNFRERHDSPSRNQLIKQLRVSPEEGLRILTHQNASYRMEMTDFCSHFIHPPGEQLFNCGAGKNISVDAYGKIQPCMSERDPALAYDLFSGRLRDALENFFPRLRHIKATNQDYMEHCAKCFLYGLCEQCPANSWSEHGTLDTPVEYLCQVAHAQALYLGLLQPGEKAWEVPDWQVRLKRMKTDLEE
jgi:radical SAM protein with 4Fe4S-binding SPASM domain